MQGSATFLKVGTYGKEDRPNRGFFMTEARGNLEEGPELPPSHLMIGAMRVDVSMRFDKSLLSNAIDIAAGATA